MNRLRWLTACAVIVSAASATGQFPLSPDINLFGDDLPQKNPAPPQPGRHFIKRLDPVKDAPADSQILVFRDGQQLHGELTEVTAEGIVWKRSDSDEVLRIPRDQVRRIGLVPFAGEAPNGFMGAVPGIPGLEPMESDEIPSRAAKTMPVKLKLPGGDWLFGAVTSADGEKFTLRLTDGTSIDIPRAQLEWLHFSPNPAPAFGFFGSALDLEGWTPESTATEIAGGTATIGGDGWIGRALSAPQRFEVALEIPPDAEEGTRLWLQPFGPQVNCYTTGTVEIQLGKTQITRQLFINRFDRQVSPYPKEAKDAAAPKGPTSYRIFYDGTGRRIVVLRNGRTVGDWKFGASKEDGEDVQAMFRQMRITGICLDRMNAGGRAPLKFSRLWLQPWNGAVPRGDETIGGQDQLSLGDAEPIVGKLDSIAAGEFVFSGESRVCKANTFVQFANAPAPLAEPVARVNLGKLGEFSVGKLEIHEGVVRCDTAFATGLEVPVKTVQAISFQSQPAMPRPAADILVFKNGDELSGKALAASSNGLVRWRTISGQELELKSGRIAGIRFAPAESGAKPAAPAATFELRNGERLRGDLVSLDEKQVQLQHPQLGALALDRSRLWHLFPSSGVEISDGGRDPESWTREAPAEPGRVARKARGSPASWVYLDGTYILRNRNTSMSPNSDQWDGLHREIPAGLDRFEVRLEAYATVASATCLLLRLSTRNSGPTWQATVSYGEVQLLVQQFNRPPNWREIPLQEKLPDLETRRAIRLFVDTKAGTGDLFVNGVLVARTGQQAGERLTPGKYMVHFQPYPNQGGPCVLSNLWIGPWTGELPHGDAATEGTTALSNGDAAPGTPKAIQDGKLAMEGEVGAFEIPVEKVQEVDFGGKMSSEPTPTRLRFADGTVVNVDQFQWDGQGLTAHSPTLGDLRLPAGVIHEIIFNPPAPHTFTLPEPPKTARHDPDQGVGLDVEIPARNAQ